MTDSASIGLYRLSLTYKLGEDGLLVPESLPAAKVPVLGEGALFRRLAKLADADDAAIVAAATRYGPLGPTTRVAVADQPAYLWALDGAVRNNVRKVRLLRAWIAYGGRTPIPGHLAPVAHALASVAEADDGTAARMVEILTDGPPPTDLERATFDTRLDRLEHRIYAGLSRRARVLNAHYAKGDRMVRVAVAPQASRQLPASAHQWRVFLETASKFGSVGELIPPGSIGRLATELRPYFNQDDLPLYPQESIKAWRDACRELAGWVDELSKPDAASTDGRAILTALLVLRLQHVDAWPYPTGDLLGTFPRALWSLWRPVTGRRPQRPCTWLGCTRLLPADAHGNRRYCDEHQRVAHRERAARNRARRRVAAS
jgi:hypothetical protein